VIACPCSLLYGRWHSFGTLEWKLAHAKTYLFEAFLNACFDPVTVPVAVFLRLSHCRAPDRVEIRVGECSTSTIAERTEGDIL